MAKKSKKFICNNCGESYARWFGKCESCQNWNSISEVELEKKKYDLEKISSIDNIFRENKQESRISLGINELDLVFGGGLVRGSLTLIAGDPGVGKSTLILEMSKHLAKKYFKDKILYISGEESSSQITTRAKRLDCIVNNLFLSSSVHIESIETIIQEMKPMVIFIDSIQTIVKHEFSSRLNSINDAKDITQTLLQLCKKTNISIILIGHITKEGNIAGPKALEHLVDTVLYFESDKLGFHRILRSTKNRFGSVGEMAIFEMNAKGLKEVSNNNQVFFKSCYEEKIGSTIGVFFEGTRAFSVELQALVVRSFYSNSRRMAEGIDNQRLILLSAVVEKYTNISNLYEYDIFMNITGGVKVQDTSLDFGICVCIYSSLLNKVLPKDIAFIGEIGLAGEVRAVSQIDKRLKELSQHNFKTVVLPKFNQKEIIKSYGMELIFTEKLNEFQQYL